MNIWIARGPINPLQAHLLDGLRKRLEDYGCIFVEDTHQKTALGPVAHMGMLFGLNLEEEISPVVSLTRLPKPRGSMLVLNAVERMPDGPLFDVARSQTVRKSGHFTIMVEGDPQGQHFERALWGSMAGNNRMLEGDEDAMLDNLALRVMAHGGAEKINDHATDEASDLTWDTWSASPIHGDIAKASRALGAAGIIEDEIPLRSYGSSDQVGAALRFLNRSALGEGMRSQIDPVLRVMGITTSGGSKINVSADPKDGHIVPLRQITRSGYVRLIPDGCPINFNAPSVETHENGMVYLAGALVNAGVVNTYEGFIDYLNEHFTQHDRIDILPEGTTPKFTALDHFHRQPRAGSIRQPERVELVYPDAEHFPPIDFPCGVRESELVLLSALFQSPSFNTPGSIGDQVIFAVLPGHGAVVLYDGPRGELTDVLINEMVLEEIVRV